MVKKSRKILFIFILTFFFSLMTVIVAYALTITIDGVINPTTEWDGSGSSSHDPPSPQIPDDVDMETLRYTNNLVDMFFLIETYAPPRLEDSGTGSPTRIYICIDIDNTVGTGISYPNCSGMSGIDRIVFIDGTNNPVVLDDSLIQVGTGTMAFNQVIEIGVPFAALGIADSDDCIQDMPAAVYYDNGQPPPDDQLEDVVGCGSPTAVELVLLEANTNTAVPFALLGVALILLVSGGAIFAYKRRRA
jgi:hypothetical protein